MSTNNGAPAFPAPNWYDNTPAGMSLRDYFASKAMPDIYRRVESGGFNRVAKLSYELADAMLAARGDA